ERTDFAAADLDAELAARVAEVRAWRGVDAGDPALVAAGLRAALETPLAALEGRALRSFARADRLDELAFELPLAGGDEPYGLQALLYAVALHRYLRWRLPGYDPGRNLAGVLYLFLRGMTGDPAQGVFAWRPSGALVRDLSDVLDAGAAA